MSEEGIISSKKGNDFWWSSGSIPDALSVAKWSTRNRAVPQQTFLGASIKSFSVAGGLATPSSLDIELVEDEFNKSDGFGLGGGDDPYHDGKADQFRPPVVDAPVFFKFGNIHCDIEHAWRKTYDDIYGYNTIDIKPVVPTFEVDSPEDLSQDQYIDFLSGVTAGGKFLALDESVLQDWNGKGIDHFVFGGIIKSHKKAFDDTNTPSISCNVEDPRSILEGTKLVLNSWGGNNFNLANYLNVYGFLEHDLSEPVKTAVNAFYNNSFLMSKNITDIGEITYKGQGLTTPYDIFNLTDCQCTPAWLLNSSAGTRTFGLANTITDPYAPVLPITGKGLSRDQDNGIPLFRVLQAVEALTQVNGLIPAEYLQYGGRINFKGYNYIVDISDVPVDLIPISFRINENSLSMLSLIQQISEITNCDYYVSLLPIINHPQCLYLYNYNLSKIQSTNPLDYKDIIAGIIKVHFIRKKVVYTTTAIKDTVEDLELRGVNVTSKSYGVESAENISDKVLMGGKEANIKFFRRSQSEFCDAVDTEGSNDLFDFTYHLNKSMMPYYGTLNDGALSIPKGRGFFQQALLDSSNIDAYGVGQYYLTTYAEMEAALRGYEDWESFLRAYNDPNSYSIPCDKNGKIGVSSPRSLFVNPYSENLNLNSASETIYEYHVKTNEMACFPNLGEYVYANRYSVLALKHRDYSKEMRRLSKFDEVYNNHLQIIVDRIIELPVPIVLGDEITSLIQLNPVDDFTKRIKSSFKIGLGNALKNAKNKDELIELINVLKGQLSTLYANVAENRVNQEDHDRISENNLRAVYQMVENAARENRTKICVKLPKAMNYRYSADQPYEFSPKPGFNIATLDAITQDRLITSPFYFLDYDYSQVKGTSMSCFYDVMQNDLVFNYNISSNGWFDPYLLDNFVFPTELQTILNAHKSPVFRMNLLPKNFKQFLGSDGRFENYCIFNSQPEFPLNTISIEGNNYVATHTNELYAFTIDSDNKVGRNRFNRYMLLFGDFLNIANGTVEGERLFKRVTISDKIHVVPNYLKGDFKKTSMQMIKTGNFLKVDVLTAAKVLNTESYYFYDDLLFGVKKVVSDKPSLNTSHCYAIVDFDFNLEQNENYRATEYYPENPNILNRIDDTDDLATFTEEERGSVSVATYVNGSNFGSFSLNDSFANSISIFGEFRIPNVLPEIVCIAMESNERRYGPWVSNQLEGMKTAYNIPGSVDHVVNDSLTPWNYSGYNLMNQAAAMQVANFNSRRVFIENGSFVLAGPPIGNSIMRPIAIGGPLITSVSTSISEDMQIETTYEMKTHVPDLSRLQDIANQRMEAIASLARRRFVNTINLMPSQRIGRDVAMGSVVTRDLEMIRDPWTYKINRLDVLSSNRAELDSRNGKLENLTYESRKQLRDAGIDPRKKRNI